MIEDARMNPKQRRGPLKRALRWLAVALVLMAWQCNGGGSAPVVMQPDQDLHRARYTVDVWLKRWDKSPCGMTDDACRRRNYFNTIDSMLATGRVIGAVSIGYDLTRFYMAPDTGASE